MTLRCELAKQLSGAGRACEEGYLEPAFDHMFSNPSHDWTARELALVCQIHESAFLELFMSFTGESVSDFLGGIRIVSADKIRSSLHFMLALRAITLVFGAAFSVLLTRTITRPIIQAVEVASTVASGDLSLQVTAQSLDETGQLLRSLDGMSRSLAGIVAQVRVGTNAIATDATQLASGNTDLSSRTEEQAASLEQTAGAMEEFTATVGRNSDSAERANSLSRKAAERARRGGNAVERVTSTMRGISSSSQTVEIVVEVIEGIAFQTNILALNAAVGAARAGELGRGFAVVAGEVRALAQRSASSAREIKALISPYLTRNDCLR